MCEVEIMLKRWETNHRLDPQYNINLTISREDYAPSVRGQELPLELGLAIAQ